MSSSDEDQESPKPVPKFNHSINSPMNHSTLKKAFQTDGGHNKHLFLLTNHQQNSPQNSYVDKTVSVRGLKILHSTLRPGESMKAQKSINVDMSNK